MSLYILILTHLGCIGLGAALSYFFILRYTKVVEHEGHPAIEIMPQEERMDRNGVRWPGLVILAISVIAVIIGVQTYLGKDKEDQRDKRDAEYATCIKNYAQDAANGIVETIETRNAANAKVEAAEIVRDNAVDRVIEVVGQARQVPPRATAADFDRALQRAAEAKIVLRETRAAAKEVKDKNAYKDAVPEPECVR